MLRLEQHISSSKPEDRPANRKAPFFFRLRRIEESAKKGIKAYGEYNKSYHFFSPATANRKRGLQNKKAVYIRRIRQKKMLHFFYFAQLASLRLLLRKAAILA